MNGKELLNCMDYVDPKYIAEAEAAAPSHRSRLSLRRPLLAAALIAMALLLVGCAVVYVLSLQDMKLGEHTYLRPRHLDEAGNRVSETEIVKDVISLQSVAGTPGFRAAQEWLEFEEHYDPDGTLLDAAEETPFEAPSDYDAYFVYNQEMVDRVDAIAEKYGLKLAGAIAPTEREYNRIFFEQLGLETLHLEDAAAEISYRDGYFYESGSFYMAWELTLEESDGWPHSVGGHMLYTPKGVFLPSARYVSDIGSCRQWTCQVRGQEVLIFTDGDYATACCPREDAGVALNFRITRRDDGDTLHYMTEGDIQRVVECFDFSVTPKLPDVAQARRQLDAIYAEKEKEQAAREETRTDPLTLESYGAYIQYRIEQTRDPESFLYGQDPEKIFYALRDCNGDGVEDLLLSWQEGCFTEIMTLENGQLKLLFGIGSDSCFLCEGNIIGHSSTWEGNSLYEYYSFAEDPFTKIAAVQYLTRKGTWEKAVPDDWGGWEPITEEEARSIIDSYPRTELERKPLTEYPG